MKEPVENLALSNAVRPGVIGWAKTLARELGPQGITVNSIAPGGSTPRGSREATPRAEARISRRSRLGRLGSPREVADVVCFLASTARAT